MTGIPVRAWWPATASSPGEAIVNAVELLSPEQANPGNPKWHTLRRDGVTASEIAAVLGLSPWDSPFSLYWRKINGWCADDPVDMSTGRRVEPVVADWWATPSAPRQACTSVRLASTRTRPGGGS